MPTILMIGGGLASMACASLLAADGHDVRVLERDRAEPPNDAEAAFGAWDRRGVSQFRQAYGVQPGLTRAVEAHLPAVNTKLVKFGALSMDFACQAAPTVPQRDALLGDPAMACLTARRPVMELAFAQVALETKGVAIERGVGVRSYVTSRASTDGAPRVTGVVTEDGRTIHADLVIDATGRNSRIVERITDVGGRPPVERQFDNSTIYYTRHYESPTGVLSDFGGGPLFQLGQSIGLYLLPADNGTWCLAVWGLAEDQALRPLRNTAVFDAVVRRFEDREQWLAGTPLTDVVPCVSAADLTRSFVIDGAPVITGLLPLGDAAAFTEPRVGRGTLLSFLQAVAVRDALREGADDDPAELVVRWDAQFQEQVAPTLRATNGVTRGPTKGMRAYISGDEPVLDRTNRGAVLNRAFENAARIDHDIARLLGELGASVALPHERLGPSTVERILDIGDHDELDLPPAGPSRGELLDLLAGR